MTTFFLARHRYRRERAALTLLAFASLALAQDAMQNVPRDKMDLRFVSTQMNVPIEGRFRKFTASAIFDPAKPETAKAEVEIDMASVDFGLEEAETEVKRPAWFDTAKYPTASFVSSSVKPLGGGRYEVAGKLTIKGTSRGLTAPVTVTPHAGGGNDIAGVFTINRLDYRIGEGEWADTDTVADAVQIRFKATLADGSASRK